ncbi:MAG: hypothetical protein MZU97_16560 [Bacillus subtilis]|nr:hypothetical protein [Bacillus subtilis]
MILLFPSKYATTACAVAAILPWSGQRIAVRAVQIQTDERFVLEFKPDRSRSGGETKLL